MLLKNVYINTRPINPGQGLVNQAETNSYCTCLNDKFYIFKWKRIVKRTLA